MSSAKFPISVNEETIHNKIRAERMLQTYGSNASVEDAIRSTGGIVSQDEGGVKQKYSREIQSIEELRRDESSVAGAKR